MQINEPEIFPQTNRIKNVSLHFPSCRITELFVIFNHSPGLQSVIKVLWFIPHVRIVFLLTDHLCGPSKTSSMQHNGENTTYLLLQKNANFNNFLQEEYTLKRVI